MLRYLCATLILLALPVAGAAQGVEVGLQKKYGKMKSFRADFIQRLTHKESGSTEERRGTLLFRKPLLVRWETVSPHAELLIVTDKEIWDYLPDEEVVYRYSPQLAQDSRSLIQVITGQARLDEDFTVRDEGPEGDLRELRLYPKEPTPQMVEGAVWVDAGNLIRKAVIIDFYGNSNEVVFTELRPDAGLPDGAFTFTPPKGVEVEDQIGKDIQERELFK